MSHEGPSAFESWTMRVSPDTLSPKTRAALWLTSLALMRIDSVNARETLSSEAATLESSGTAAEREGTVSRFADCATVGRSGVGVERGDAAGCAQAPTTARAMKSPVRCNSL